MERAGLNFPQEIRIQMASISRSAMGEGKKVLQKGEGGGRRAKGETSLDDASALLLDRKTVDPKILERPSQRLLVLRFIKAT